jgi:hypothetical protein
MIYDFNNNIQTIKTNYYQLFCLINSINPSIFNTYNFAGIKITKEQPKEKVEDNGEIFMRKNNDMVKKRLHVTFQATK